VAAITVYSAPEDGRKGRPKHVEHKHNTARVASCWFIIYYIAEAAVYIPGTVPAGIPVDRHAQYFVTNDQFLLTILQAFANCSRTLYTNECF